MTETPEDTSSNPDSTPIVTESDFEDITIAGAETTPPSNTSTESSTDEQCLDTETESESEIDHVKDTGDEMESVMKSDTDSQSISDTNRESSDTPEIDTDFSDVDINSHETRDAGSDTSTEADTVDTESVTETESTQTTETPFTDSDASETWGTTTASDTDTTSQTVDRSAPEPTESDQSSNTSTTTPNETGTVDSNTDSDTSIDTDFSTVDVFDESENTDSIESASQENSTETPGEHVNNREHSRETSQGDQFTDSSDNTPGNDIDNSDASQPPVKTREQGSNGTGTDSTSETTSSNTDSVNKSESDGSRNSVSSTDVPTPDVEPPQRVRTPQEIILEPVQEITDTAKTAAVVTWAMGLFVLRGVLILAEWTMSIFLFFYAVFIGMALTFPAGAVPHNGGATSRLGVIIETAVVIIPLTIAVFGISMLIDTYLYDGERYKHLSQPVFSRL